MNANDLSPLAPAAGLDGLVERARALMENARSAVTRSGYARDFAAYQLFCRAHGLPAMPLSGPVVALYLADCSTRLRTATIARRIAAIADAARRSGSSTEALRSFVVRETWKGIRRTLGIAPVVKSPLLAAAVRDLVRACPETMLGMRDRVLVLVGFAGGFRRSELTAIGLDQLTFASDAVTISVPRSKADQEGEGRTVTLRRASSKETCPVAAIEAWVRGAGIKDGLLLRSVDRQGRVGGGINPDSIARILKRAAARAHLAIDLSAIAGHSLRAGLVTQASLDGISPLAVMEVTGHRTMAVVKRYFRAQLAGGPSAAGAGL